MATAQFTVTPATPTFETLVTFTTMGAPSAVLTVPVWLLPELTAMVVAADDAVPVALNVTGEPVSPATVAVAVCAPTVAPSVQLIVARPEALVTDVAADTLPPPVTMAQFTVTPATGAADALVTLTTIGLASAVLTVPVWLLPELTAMVVAGAAVALAEKVRGEPVRPATVAVTVCTPTDAPSVQFTCVCPSGLVTLVSAETFPPPVATAPCDRHAVDAVAVGIEHFHDQRARQRGADIGGLVIA